MNARIKIVRAIGSEFVARKLKLIVIILSVVSVSALLVAFWLTTVSAWWWLLAVPLIVFTIFGFIAYLLAKIIIKFFRPELTRTQTSDVSDFVDKLERIAENLQTPMFIIVFRVLRDVIRPHDKTFIKTATQDSTSLHKDFLKLQQSFN